MVEILAAFLESKNSVRAVRAISLVVASCAGIVVVEDAACAQAPAPAISSRPQRPGGREDAPTPRYVMTLPRPADPERRKALGFPPPRQAKAILDEIDGIAAAMQPILAKNDVWKRRFREYRAMQSRRIGLVSELEEAGYQGEALPALVITKLRDIADTGSLSRSSAMSYEDLRREIVRRYPGSKAATQARADSWMDYVHVARRMKMRIHPGDYAKLAKVELARRNDDMAGILLLEALVGERGGDRDLVEHWHDWILENLGPQSIGHRKIMRLRAFGAPIRLQGEDFEGRKLDTASWKGSVILVDFWGTWCRPCLAALPHLRAIQQKYAEKGLRVVGVLCDFEVEKARRLLAERGCAWPQFVHRGATPKDLNHPIAREYAVGAYPTLWLIDRDGVLREAVNRDKLEQTVLRYLNQSAEPSRRVASRSRAPSSRPGVEDRSATTPCSWRSFARS